MFTSISGTNLLYHLIGLIYLTGRDGISWVGGSYHLLPYSIVLGSGYTRDSPTSNFDDQRMKKSDKILTHFSVMSKKKKTDNFFDTSDFDEMCRQTVRSRNS